MGLGSAIGKWMRAVGYLLTFRVNKASEALRANPGVISANYDRIIEEKKGRLNSYQDAIAGLVMQQENKKATLKQLTADITRLEQLKAGAAAAAKKVAAKFTGDAEKTKADPEYQKCLRAFNDFSATLTEKNARATELENDIGTLQKTIDGHKINIQSELRALEKLKEEKHEAVADVISASEEKRIADLMTGLAQDRTGEELLELRELRQKAKAGAQVARELSGLDAKRQETEFLKEFEAGAANGEFEALMNFNAEKPAKVEEKPVAAAPVSDGELK